MKRLLIFVVVFFLAQFARAASFHFPHYEKYQLPNGLTVFLMEQHEVPLISMQMVWQAGAVNDDKSFGLAHFTAQALPLGTKQHSKKQLDETFEFYGTSPSCSAGSESFSVELELNKKDFPELFPLFAEIVMQPSFPKNEVEKRKKQLIDDLKLMKESPRSMISLEFARFVFADHPYGNPVPGTEESLSHLNANALQNFYQQYLNPDSAALIIVGDISLQEMKAQVEKQFALWQESTKAVPSADITEPILPNEPRVLLVNKPDAHETTFMIGGKGMARNDPHFTELNLINTILGGRFTSWLNDELRINSGLTYGARSYFNASRKTGAFAVSTFTKRDSTFPAIDLALKTYQRLWDKGIDAATLTSAKEYVKGQFAPKYETSSQLADALAGMFIYGFDESYINDYFKKVDALTLTEANKLAQEFFPKDALQFVLIGNADQLREGAAKYGKVSEKGI